MLKDIERYNRKTGLLKHILVKHNLLKACSVYTEVQYLLFMIFTMVTREYIDPADVI